MSQLLPVTYRGVPYRTVVDLCRALGRDGDYSMIYTRIKRGWSAEQAVEIPKALPHKGVGSVYLITRISTGQQYVGVTTMSVEERWHHHLFNSRRYANPLASAIASDGPDGFTRVVLESNVPRDRLAGLEVNWIKRLGTLAPAGLNANAGGSLGGRRGTGRNAKAQAISDQYGVNINTARRWANEGRVGGVARRYQAHNSTKHPLFKRWHGMRGKGGVCPEWECFDRWLREAAPIITAGKMVRIDTNLPWSISNIRPRKHG